MIFHIFIFIAWITNLNILYHTEIYTEEKSRRKIYTKYTTTQTEKRLIVKIHRSRHITDSTSKCRATNARLSVKTEWKKKCQDVLSLNEPQMSKKKKHESKNRERRKPAKNLSSKELELRNVEEIPPAQLNELLSEFVSFQTS